MASSEFPSGVQLFLRGPVFGAGSFRSARVAGLLQGLLGRWSSAVGPSAGGQASDRPQRDGHQCYPESCGHLFSA